MEDLAEQLRRARREGGAFLLPSRLRLRLSGPDAFRYLNGQVTRDLGRLKAGESMPACLLTPKGKLCAPLLITADSADLIIESDPLLQEALMARLERYIVADDVAVTVEPPQECIHVFGEMAELEPWASASSVRTYRLGVPGQDLKTSDARETAMPELLDSQVVEALRIERGLPAWGSELGEETLPPEAGLDRTHIDYDRGCYPGQEVISRLKSIGRVNRLLCRLRAPSRTPLQPGMGVVTESGNQVGELTSVSPTCDTGSRAALGYLARGTGGALFALDPLTGGKTPLTILETTPL